jgi:hypothetical protein
MLEEDRDYQIYHLDIIPNSQEIMDYLEKLYWENDGSTDLEMESVGGWFIPYFVLKEGEAELHWSNHENVMKGISVHFANVEFNLYSQGPKFGDVWKKVFYNGTIQYYVGKLYYQEVKEL